MIQAVDESGANAVSAAYPSMNGRICMVTGASSERAALERSLPRNIVQGDE